MIRNSRLLVFLALVLAGSMWFYVQHVVIRQQIVEAKSKDIPRGNLSDLYPRWLGTRELLLHHRDPYSAEVTREIQTGYYGRPLDSSRPHDPKDQQAFAYPLYVVFLLAPLISLPFSAVQMGFFWCLVAVTIVTILLWLGGLQWHPSWAMKAAFIVLTLGSFQVLQGLKLQQLTLLVSGLIAATVALLAAGQLLIAGILLALTTIKPQLILPLAAWLILWTVSEWGKRKNFAFGFGGTLAVLIAGAQLLLPGWITQFHHAIFQYRQYNDGALSILQVLTSPLAGDVLAMVALLVTAILCWELRREPATSTAFAWMTALVLAVTILVAPKTSPYNQILLLPGVLIVAQHWRIAWNKSFVARIVFLISILIVLWPWVAAFAVTVLRVFLPTTLPNAWTLPVYTMLAIPFAVCVLVAFNLRALGQTLARGKAGLAAAK